MIELKNFSVKFGERILLEDISTTFPAARLTALIGRNGTGKSTMLKAICGLNFQFSGKVLIDGLDLRKIPKGKLATKIAYVNTRRPRIANLRCHEIVALGRSPYTGWNGKLSPKDENIIEKSLDMVGMSDYSHRYFNSLSDGESQKIMIARAIAQDTPNLILDEPTSFLDLPTRHEIVSLLKRLAVDNSKTVVFSTHELDIALKFSNRIALINNGELFNLTPDELKKSDLLSNFFYLGNHEND